MTKINSGSDFIMRIQFYDSDGAIIPIPIFDFKIEYFVKPDNTIMIEHTAGAYITDENTKVIVEGNTLTISCDNIDFGVGKLRSRKTYYLPDERFVDGHRTLIEETTTEYTLI